MDLVPGSRAEFEDLAMGGAHERGDGGAVFVGDEARGCTMMSNFIWAEEQGKFTSRDEQFCEGGVVNFEGVQEGGEAVGVESLFQGGVVDFQGISVGSIGMGEEEGELHLIEGQMRRNGPKMPLRRVCSGMVLYAIYLVSIIIVKYSKAVESHVPR